MSEIVSKWLQGHTIDLNSVQCLNNQSRQDVCDKCIKGCPTAALQSSSNKGIELNTKLCLYCGKCVSDCPVLAVDFLSKPYTKTIKEMTAYPNSSITCEQFDKYQKGIKVPCYLYYDTAMLTHYVTVSKELPKDEAGNSIVEMYLGHCEQCNYKEHISVQKHIIQLQDWFDQVGMKVLLKVTNDEKKYLLKEGEEAADGITRRSLFKSFSFSYLRGTKEQEVMHKDTATEVLDEMGKNLYKRALINQGIALFRDQVEKNDKELPTDEFAMVSKKEACTKCNICEKICPTDALIWADTKDCATLYFYPQKCIACRKCMVCPTKSISVNPITASDYINNTKKLISQFQTGKCTDCGDTFRKNNESQELCPICKKKGATARTLFDLL